MIMSTKQQQLFERYLFYSPDGCWYWTGSTQTKGYGHFINHSTHRLSYHTYKNHDPGNLNVCHTCDNRLCVNPDHLWLGTHLDNVMDKVRKGRQSRGPNHWQSVAIGMSKLTLKRRTPLEPTGMFSVDKGNLRVISYVGMEMKYKNFSTWLVRCKYCGLEEVINIRKIRRRKGICMKCKNLEPSAQLNLHRDT
jgi:hypothetical protein